MSRTFAMIRRSAGALLCLLAACSPASLVDVSPPNSFVDPAAISTPTAAMQLYYNAVTAFDNTFGGGSQAGSGTPNFQLAVGVFTDELMRVQFNTNAIFTTVIDERFGSGTSYYSSQYDIDHQARALVSEAREGLQRYAPNTSALQGQMQALEANTVLWFAELFCSGIPLTTAPLVGAPVATRGFSTQELLERAVAMFDSAIVLSPDSTQYANLAKVGKGRALLGLGRFADAAAAVQGVPTDFVYNTRFNASVNANYLGKNPQNAQVVDNEGTNGLVWSTDPRTATTTVPATYGAMKLTAKFSGAALNPAVASPNSPIRLADGLEARLIEAEAALAANSGSWLTILNTLRSGCVGTAVCAPVPGIAAAALPALVDPGTVNGRLDLLMKERAMWLYLTGHRQGDLRRLARVYHRDPGTLWPTGVYVNPGFAPFSIAASTNGTAYGPDVVFTPSSFEVQRIPIYKGCDNLDP